MTTYRLCNLAYQIPGDHRLLRDVRDGRGFDEPADVLLLVEARDGDNKAVDVAGALGRGWTVSQDTSSGARAGSVIATDRRRARLRWSLSRLLSRKARKVQNRYQRSGAVRPKRGKVKRINVVHFPLPSTGQQPEAERALRAWVDRQREQGHAWLVAGDFNQHHDVLRRKLGAPHSFGKDVMGFIYSGGWGDVDFHASNYRGSDHAVLTMTTKE